MTKTNSVHAVRLVSAVTSDSAVTYKHLELELGGMPVATDGKSKANGANKAGTKKRLSSKNQVGSLQQILQM